MNGIISIIEKIAMLGAGAASWGFFYQPKTPKCLMK